MTTPVTGTELVHLKNIVVRCFSESHWLELGVLTNMIDSVERHPRLLRSLSWGDPDYDGLALSFLRDMIGHDGENLELVRRYVTDKCPAEGENVSSEPTEGKRIVFSPSVFAVPTEPMDTSLVSVMMSFRPELSDVYKTIRNAADETGFNCRRADDIWDDSTVIQDVFSLIFRSYIVVCDFTGKNPNVFYEAGIAHTLGKHVVPITQSEHDIPFDLQHHRYAKYLHNCEGLEKLKQELTVRFSTLASKRNIGW